MFKRMQRQNRILVLGRNKDPNLGDVVITDACAYLLDRIIRSINNSFFWRKSRFIFGRAMEIPPVEKANVNNVKEANVKANMEKYDKIVFPGGGINSMKVTNALLERMKITLRTKFYFNAIGVHPVRHKKALAKNIEKVLNDKRVRQVTTRGDFEMTREYIKRDMAYPVEWIVDPALCSNDVYGVSRDEKSEMIGIGPIRPEIFVEQDRSITVEEVYAMYGKLFEEADARGYKWKVFCNGTERDYEFAVEVLERFGYDKDRYLVRRPTKARELVEDISAFKGVIAARFHANIIATSLSVPSVALVWNVKMRGFSELVGCPERYIEDRDKLLDAAYLLDTLEEAMRTGYDRARIAEAKNKAYRTLKNVVLDGSPFQWYFRIMNSIRKESVFK